MTGYASGQQAAPAAEARPVGGHLGLEIRSVNSRFLDLTFRLPEELRAFEPALRELLTAKLRRGKVELRAFIEAGAGTVAEPSPRLLQRLGAVQDGIVSWLPDAKRLSVADVLRLAAGEQAARHDWSELVLPLAQQVVASLLESRQREGARLAAMLLERIAQLRVLAQQAAPLVPQLVEQQRQRFLERWQEAMGLAEGGGSQVAQQSAQEKALAEATAFAIRIDVAEEITRLGSHLDELERLIKKGGEIDKRLDFLIQELHREANTLGSKSAALELTRISVDMKVLIEQMREQVQNIE
jgi:uncharacterized protein (TIGR00255 family)